MRNWGITDKIGEQRMSEELKPCPFCGGEAKYFAYADGGVCVRCLDCYCQTFNDYDLTVANARKSSAFERITEAWNKRKGVE